MQPLPDFTFEDSRFGAPMRIRAEFACYADGNPAIKLVVHGQQNDSFDGEPWGTATVNVPAEKLPPDHVVIKNWSEGEGLPALLVKAGVIESENPTHRFPLNNVTAEVYKLTPMSLEAVAEAISDYKPPRRARP